MTPQEQDEELFQTSRLVNNACFVNVLVTSYVPILQGIPDDNPFFIDPLFNPKPDTSHGNQVSMEFNLLYRWHSGVSESDEAKMSPMLDYMAEQMANAAKENTGIDRATITNNALLKFPSELQRQKPNGAYADADLAKVINDATRTVAGRLGANNIPKSFRAIEISGIMQGRKAGVCTLNEFRKYFNVKPYNNFKEFNNDPQIETAMKKLYDNIDDVELYVGLIAEKNKKIGIGFGYSCARGILTDAINATRNDRFLSEEVTPFNITEWGYKYAKGNPKEFDGRIFPVLLLNHFPGIATKDAPWLKHPFRLRVQQQQ